MSGVRLAGTALRELRIHLCQKSTASAGVRSFIESDYVAIKKANPNFPILIREASGIAPRVFARYEHGVERSVQLQDATKENVLSAIKDLASKQ
ncbi:unnamed protein product [Auanema sp. JU1783]|nr:unnamed protein product [Auanema sp. JU1783]